MFTEDKVKDNSVTLRIKRSAYYIEGYRPKMSPLLERTLSVYSYLDKVYTHRGFVYDEENEILKVPSGLDLEILTGRLSSDDVTIKDIINERKEFVTSKRLTLECDAVPKDVYQTKAVHHMVAQGASSEKVAQRMVTLDTGFGKTVCEIMASCKLQMPTVVTSVNLSKQWVERILQFTNGELGKTVFHLKSWQDAKKLLDKPKPARKGMFFIIGLDAMVAGLKNDSNFLMKFHEEFGVGIQVFDECHEHFIKILKVLVNINVERVIYLSATPNRTNKNEDNLYKRLFRENVPTYGCNTHNINKFNIVMMTFKTRPGQGDMFRIQARRGIHAMNYFKYLLRGNYNTNKLITIIRFYSNFIFTKKLGDPNTKVLVYVQSLKMISRLKAILEENYKPVYDLVPKIGDYSGNVPPSKRHLELEGTNIIFLTTNVKAGLDLDGLALIINLTPFSSPIILKQIRGRLRDKDGYYVDCTDLAFVGMIRQMNSRLENHEKVSKKLVHYHFDDSRFSVVKGRMR